MMFYDGYGDLRGKGDCFYDIKDYKYKQLFTEVEASVKGGL